MGLPETLFVQTKDIVCVECGIHFWVEAAWVDERRADAKTFHCPNGHSLSWKEKEIDQLKKRLEAKEAELARERTRSEQKDRANAALRGQVTKIKNRVQHGVCPCCNRTFQNVARHMATKHPDWKEQELGVICTECGTLAPRLIPRPKGRAQQQSYRDRLGFELRVAGWFVYARGCPPRYSGVVICPACRGKPTAKDGYGQVYATAELERLAGEARAS